MTNTVRMKLVFRLGGIGFALSVQDLIEIREDPGGVLDRSRAEAEPMILGRLMYRGEAIPVIDLGRCLEVPSSTTSPIVLILAGESGTWGTTADRVEGIFAESEFESRPLPILLRGPSPLPYAGVELWRDEPLVLCEAKRLEDLWGGREL
jgi:purine-binding chemotaxis protein CheW